jgi:hypothetical protein
MLQEAEVARDIAAGGGVVIVLAMLQEHVEVSIHIHTCYIQRILLTVYISTVLCISM